MMSRKWRQPTIIWLRTVKKEREWRRRRKGVNRPGRGRSRHSGWPRRIPWNSLSLYALVLLLAAFTLWRIPPQLAAAPVTGPLGLSHAPSWLDRAVGRLNVSKTDARHWLTEGIPLMGWVNRPESWPRDWSAIMLAGLADTTGVHLDSLKSLLRLEIPTLALVRPTSGLAVATPPRPPAQEERDAGLPGDNGRVWAELGQEPTVGIYQTHSHESFWPVLPAGSATAYSTHWDKTIVQVGWWLAQDLNHNGVGVVQSRVDNMSEGLLASYNRSYYTAKQLLRWYPTVHILLDLHRSSVAVPAVTVHGVKMADILIVVGTNKLLPDPYWHQNLEFAIRLAKALGTVAPGILRGQGIDMVPYRYNQQLMPADLMVEIGGVNNTLAEERYAAHALAEALTLCIRQGAVPGLSAPKGN